MKRMRILGLAVVAVFAVTAFAASSALALPEFGRCIAKAGTGKYKDANCTLKAGKVVSEKAFEFVKTIEKKNFTSAGGAGVLETESGTRVECTGQSATGEFKGTTSFKEVKNVVARFTGCTLPLLGAQCGTAGSAAGEIVTQKLTGKLGYIAKATKTVGQELKPEVKGGAFVVFECSSAAKIVVKEGTKKLGHNCVIAQVGPVNTSSTTSEEKYLAKGSGVQNPEKFEGTAPRCNLESALNGGAAELSSQSLLTTITAEEAIEIKA
jgi:hypothetical protein